MKVLISIQKICIAIAAGAVLVWSCARHADEKAEIRSAEQAVKVVGAESCKTCHESQYNDWIKSDHFRAMQEAADSTVLGDFNNAVFVADGVTSKFFKREGHFFINTQGEDGKNHDYQVVYTFGHFPLQQYLVSFPGGRLQATRVSWDSRAGKWFHQYSGEKVHAQDWLHWTGNGQNWNTMCASCHSTNLQKNYSFENDTYNTTWDEINVSCETCHGPGNQHLAYIKSGKFKEVNGKIPHAGLEYGKDPNPTAQLNTCAPCHARMSELFANGKPSAELLDRLIPHVISNEFYYGDGQIRDEVYEYGSFAQSKMFHNNVQCSNCHNAHSGKVKDSGNKLCLSCHTPQYDSKEHHFHGESTGEATQCVNCHMVTKSFMGNDHRRDHSFRVPRPDQSVVYGTPNACTNCHKDKTPKWASNAINKWYGSKRAYHFSDDLLPGSLLNEKSEQHLVKLLKDTLQPAIARATAAYYLGNIQTMASAKALIESLVDRNAQIRYQSLRALENYPPQIWREEAAIGLKDNVRAVRIAAANLYHKLPHEEVPKEYAGDYAKADAENRKNLNSQTDFAVGNVMLADYEMQSGEHLQAIEHYIRGLKKDSLMNYARLNLATAFNIVGKNDQALAALNEARAIDPKNDRTYYNLGLLYYELGNIEMARQSFDDAVKLDSQNPSLYYNYGLLLQGMGRAGEGEQTLLRGYSISPANAEINYALAVLYYQQGKRERSAQHARILKQILPHAPEYQELFRGLGI